MKFFIFIFSILYIFPTNSFADCENFLRGFHVDNSFSDHHPNESVYYLISSEDLGLRTTIVVHTEQCVSVECKAMVGTLDDANFHQLIKLGVDRKICEDLFQYFMGAGGGSTDDIPIELVSSIARDRTYPF